MKQLLIRILRPLLIWLVDVHPPEWRSIDDLPPDQGEEEEWDERCVVVWQDSDHPLDIGVELTCLAHIREGDFHRDRYHKPVWRTVMDADPFDYPNDWDH